MLSAFCCMTSCHISANFGVPAVGSPFPVKKFGARKRSGCTGVNCACVHFFRVISSRHRHLVQPHLRSERPNFSYSLLFGLMIAPYNRGFPHPLAIKEVICETVSEEASAKEPTNAASKFSLIGLPALALALSIGFVGQPACAVVKPAEVGVQMEVVSGSAPSVEAILAKQLAHRFREMSDEELVDILQQLLKASRSSLNSQNAVGDGTRSQDLIIQKENREVETKAADRIRDDARVPPTQTDTSPGKEIKKDRNTFSETQSGNARAPEETSEGTGGEAPLPQANNKFNGQVNKRKNETFYEKANSKEPQGQGLPTEMENIGKVQSKETQETLRGANSASPGAPSAKNNSGDASVRSNSDSPATSGQPSAAELSSAKAENDAKGGVREEEDLTELLWTEWSRRAGGPLMKEPEASSTSFNIAEFGQDTIMKVTAFNVLQRTAGVFIIWVFFMVLAFYLGRSRAASREKETPKSKDSWINNQGNQMSRGGRARGDLKLGSGDLSRVSDYFQDSGKGLKEFMSKGDRESDAGNREEKNYEEDFLSGEGETSMKDDQPNKGKRWRTPVIERLLLKETAARKNQGMGDKLLSDSILGRDEEEEDLSYSSSNGGTRSDSTSSGEILQRSTADSANAGLSHGNLAGFPPTSQGGSDAINSEMEQLQDRPDGEETSGVPQTPLYSSSAVVNSVDSGSREPQAAVDWPRPKRSQSPWAVDWRNAKLKEARDNYPSGEEEDQGEPSSIEVKYISTISRRDVVFSSKGLNLDHGRTTSRAGDVYSRILEKLSSSRFVPDLELYEQVRQKDSLEDLNAKQNVARVEGSLDNQFEAELNSFVHDRVLWVRDEDGIFIPEAVAMEDDEDSQGTSFSEREDMHESTPLFDAERNRITVGKSNLPSSVGSMAPTRGRQTGFDYRKLVIEPRDQFSPREQQWASTESEPAAARQHMWPLRYMSGRQEVSQ